MQVSALTESVKPMYFTVIIVLFLVPQGEGITGLPRQVTNRNICCTECAVESCQCLEYTDTFICNTSSERSNCPSVTTDPEVTTDGISNTDTISLHAGMSN